VLLERSERKGLFLEAVIRECGWERRVRVDATDAERYKPGEGTGGIIAGKGMSAADITNRGDHTEEPHPLPEAASGAALPRPEETGFDQVISRATLAPARLLELAAEWVKPGGFVFLLAGDEPLAKNVRGRRSMSGPFTPVAQERIPGRRSSYLHVFQSRE